MEPVHYGLRIYLNMWMRLGLNFGTQANAWDLADFRQNNPFIQRLPLKNPLPPANGKSGRELATRGPVHHLTPDHVFLAPMLWQRF